MIFNSIKNRKQEVRQVNFNIYDMDYVCVKAPMFSFTRLQGADPVLRVEMASTGEVACFGDNKHEAYLHALISSGFKVPSGDVKTILISAGPIKSKVGFLESARMLGEMGFVIYATPRTHIFLSSHGINSIKLNKPNS